MSDAFQFVSRCLGFAWFIHGIHVFPHDVPIKRFVSHLYLWTISFYYPQCRLLKSAKKTTKLKWLWHKPPFFMVKPPTFQLFFILPTYFPAIFHGTPHFSWWNLLFGSKRYRIAESVLQAPPASTAWWDRSWSIRWDGTSAKTLLEMGVKVPGYWLIRMCTMCVHMYIYIHICTCIEIYVQVYKYMYNYINIHLYQYTFIWRYIYINIHLYVHIVYTHIYIYT